MRPEARRAADDIRASIAEMARDGTLSSIYFRWFLDPNNEALSVFYLEAADKYVRVTTGKLPETEFCFLDEIFKASSAILNTLLKILNERTFDPGDGVVRTVPLKLCLAASNEWPNRPRLHQVITHRHSNKS